LAITGEQWGWGLDWEFGFIAPWQLNFHNHFSFFAVKLSVASWSVPNG
jgi:hypothetical protein